MILYPGLAVTNFAKSKRFRDPNIVEAGIDRSQRKTKMEKIEKLRGQSKRKMNEYLDGECEGFRHNEGS